MTENHLDWKFIDLFAGIGGFRLALEENGGECVFSSEWDKNSQATYFDNHGEMPDGDITKIPENVIPAHDVLCGGFPCQAFSVSGKQMGFEDSRGTLFYDVARIARHHKPKVIFLENVKNLTRHDGGKTMQVIVGTLQDLGYTVKHRVLRSSDFGVPQARERVYILGFRDLAAAENFSWPLGAGPVKVVRDILEANSSVAAIDRDDIRIQSPLSEVADPRKPKQIGKINKGGQGERIYSIDAAGITLSAYGGGVASKTGAYLVEGTVRKLSPRECARMQGFPEHFQIPNNPNLAYKQFGDSVSVPVLSAIFKCVVDSGALD